MEALLNRLVATVEGAEDLESAARPILELLQVATGFESTYLTSIDFDRGVQRVLFSRNSQEMKVPEGLEVPWGETVCRRALEESHFYDADVPQRWGDLKAVHDLGMQTYISEPLKSVDGTVYGTLCGASARKVTVAPEMKAVLSMCASLIVRQIERERRLNRKAGDTRQMAETGMTDPLTGLANRRSMERTLGRMLERATTDGSRVQVALVEVPGLRTINEKYGHDIGDHFLLHVADRLASCALPGDLVARVDGDEFVVLAPGDESGTLGKRLSRATMGPFTNATVSFDYPGVRAVTVLADRGESDVAALLARLRKA